MCRFGASQRIGGVDGGSDLEKGRYSDCQDRLLRQQLRLLAVPATSRERVRQDNFTSTFLKTTAVFFGFTRTNPPPLCQIFLLTLFKKGKQMIPETIPTVLLDRAFYNLHDIGQMVIRLEMLFAHHLDTERLDRAVRLTMNAAPILGCRFDDNADFGCWRRLAESEQQGLEVVTKLSDYQQLGAADVDVKNGPAIKVHLLREDAGDRLHVRLAHEVADAGAVKAVACLLSDIYCRLAKDPGYTPTESLTGERNLEQVTRNLPWTAKFSIVAALIKEGIAQNKKGRVQTIGLAATERTMPIFVCRHFTEKQVSAMGDAGRGCGATLNDIFLTACFRSLSHEDDWDEHKQLSLNLTVDLRRYLRDDQNPGVCNLSGIEAMTLSGPIEESFAQTLSRVSAMTRSRKKGYLGLNIYGSPMRKMLEKMSLGKYREMFYKKYNEMAQNGKLCPTLTNMGPLPTVDFNGPPCECHLLAPPMYVPAFSIGLSGYTGAITLSAAAFGPDEPTVSHFMNAITTQLTDPESW